MPIITFVNKLDREDRDPFDLLDEIEQSLALDVTPASWPIGMGRDFLGTYDLFADALLLFERGRPRPGHLAAALQQPRRPETAGPVAQRGARQNPRLYRIFLKCELVHISALRGTLYVKDRRSLQSPRSLWQETTCRI